MASEAAQVAAGPKLTAEQLAAYRSDGYLQVNQQLFAPDRFAELNDLFEDLLAVHGPDALDVPHFREPRLLEWLLAPEVLDLVEPLTGPDIVLWSSHFISKAPGIGAPTPWHEDSAYWDGRVSTMDNIVTVWLAIDAADRGNGAMGVVPGSHREGPFDYEPVQLTGEVFDRQIVASAFDRSRATYAALAPGEFTLHDARIVHGADANRSDRRRAGYTMRYMPATSRIVPELNGAHRVWLARGQDWAGNVYENAKPYGAVH